eukprot:CAMPEP_0174297738 /NCGR_PEP_ID=MMETSP0809-20121228/51823_1 /TAXON_ID=73025 ORGANISM="Eutreptiella gymnastica-like, Strain CCMP1594" /NCGR_SAMPLE_ID=MMETSP0809 /ASSEMBLY_ACC=CAM_ASM_000658 /LENGTH=203 /DNA_ID=CAMNT_0015401717 /DNA_START=52 /DNA_END=661 /DNA_ORIENTATION=-
MTLEASSLSTSSTSATSVSTCSNLGQSGRAACPLSSWVSPIVFSLTISISSSIVKSWDFVTSWAGWLAGTSTGFAMVSSKYPPQPPPGQTAQECPASLLKLQLLLHSAGIADSGAAGAVVENAERAAQGEVNFEAHPAQARGSEQGTAAGLVNFGAANAELKHGLSHPEPAAAAAGESHPGAADAEVTQPGSADAEVKQPYYY